MQKELLFRSNPKQDISDEVIVKLPTFKDALRLSKSISGLDDKQLCIELDIDPGQWSRIWSNGAHFPNEKLTQFMDLCGNLVPLRWLALKYGFELKPLKSTLEIENEKLRAALEQKEREMDVIKDFLKEVKS